MTPCAMYTRVSSDEQRKAGYSFPYQRQRIAEYAEHNDYTIVTSFEESHSAKDPGRPEFEKMLGFVREHAEVRTILVHKQDRIARNLTDWACLKESLRVHVIAVEEPIADTPMGSLMQTFNAGLAKWYSENLSIEVKKGLRGKFEAGGCITRAPVGYRNVPRTRTEKAKVIINPETAPLVVRMFERYATGRLSLADLADELADSGLRTKTGRPYSEQRIRTILHHPFYKGLATYHGEVREGLHEAIVTERLWNTVQQTLARRHTETGEKGSRFFLLRGLLWCGRCDRRLTAEAHPRGCYYRCIPDARRAPCPERCVPLRQLETDVEALLPRIVINEDRKRDVIDALERIRVEQADARASEEQSLRSRADHLTAKLLRLGGAYGDGTMPREEYLSLRATVDSELCGVKARLDELTRDVDAEIATVRALLDRASMVTTLYTRATDPKDRKALLYEIFARIIVKDRAIVRTEYNPSFQLLLGGPAERPGSGCGITGALLDQMAANSL